MFDSGDYQACLEMALQASGYAGFEQRRAEARKRGRLLGIGIASYNEDTGIAPHEGAHVRVFSSGKIVVTTGAGAIGQGKKTVLAQIVADELGANTEDVQVEAGDTAAFPMGMSTAGSRNSVTAGSAAHIAARQVRDKAIRFAAEAMEAHESDLEITDGAVRVKPARSSWPLPLDRGRWVWLLRGPSRATAECLRPQVEEQGAAY